MDNSETQTDNIGHTTLNKDKKTKKQKNNTENSKDERHGSHLNVAYSLIVNTSNPFTFLN